MPDGTPAPVRPDDDPRDHRARSAKSDPIYRMTRQGRFPPPCSVGNGKIRWREDDVRAWMEGLPVCNYALSAQLEQNNAAAKVIGRHHG